MTRRTSQVALALSVFLLVSASARAAAAMERVVVAPDGRGFVHDPSGRPFVPWGFNYGNAGRLMEDFWADDWKTLADDFAEMRAIGARVVRVHLQYGKFMAAADRANEDALKQLDKLLALAEATGVYLDVTGLACYRKADVPAWYDALDEPARRAAQATFWETIARRCAASPAVFCYDLMNEPIVPGERRAAGDWYSGKPFGGYDFVQFVALDPKGRDRADVARDWTRAMTAAVRRGDPKRLVTVGLLPWVPKWGYLSGFVPEKVAPEVDFVSVHVYPEAGKVDDAVDVLRKFAAPGKPLVVEETFPLSCPAADLKKFLLASRGIAVGWMAHYDGQPIEELEALQKAGKITLPQSIWLDGIRLMRDLKGEMVETKAP